MDDRLLAALVLWLNTREPRLGGRVRPATEAPGTVGPYLTYTVVSTDRVGSLAHRTGQTATRVQLDVWSQDHAEAVSVAARIKGTGTEDDPSTRGLDHHVGTWPHPDDAVAPVIVQFAELVDEFSDSAAAVLGTETAWHRCSADYRIHYEETY